MRITTKIATGLMGVGVLAVSYKMGLPVESAQAVTALDGSSTTTTSTETTPTPSATPSASASATAQDTTSSSTTATKTPTKTPAKTPTQTNTTTDTGSTTNTNTGGTTNTATSTTKTGTAVSYRFGTVQVSVTKDASGAITAVDMIRSGATGGRQQAFPVLQQAAIDANGSSFGNVSGATFTTDAFKKSLDSALAQF